MAGITRMTTAMTDTGDRGRLFESEDRGQCRTNYLFILYALDPILSFDRHVVKKCRKFGVKYDNLKFRKTYTSCRKTD